jgi:hyperosmotically inducible protein
MLKRLAIGILLTLACAATGLAQQEQKVPLGVVGDIRKEVLAYTRFTVFDDISVSLDGGMVTLTGRVTMPYKSDDIGRRVARVVGVQQVRNEIKVLPVSPFDDSLRLHLARAIYGNSAFWHYATMVNPPIHIVVENGHVKLTGVVNNNVERMLAYSLASTCGAFSVQNELKTDAEMKALLEKVH